MEQEPQKKKKKKLGVIIQLIIGGIIGAFIALVGGIPMIDKLFSGEWSITKSMVFLLFVFIAIFINTNIHEFGHFMFGKMFGYTLLSYRIGFLTWNNENGKMKFLFIKNRGYDGLCAMIPPDQQLPLYKDSLFYAGGIILNIISGLAFIGVIFLPFEITETTSLFFIVLGVIALVLGIINFIPFVSHNNPTDGKILWSLILKKPFAHNLIELNKMTSQLSAGIRPRNINISTYIYIDNPQIVDMISVLFAYFIALDNNNVEDIVHYTDLIEKNMDKFPTVYLPSVYYELCYAGCIFGDEDKAKEYYKQAGKILQSDNDINGLRVKAYYEYYINRDLKVARILCDNALKVAHKFPIKGQGLMEKDLIMNLKEQIELEGLRA